MSVTSVSRWRFRAAIAFTIALLFALSSTVLAFAAGGAPFVRISVDPYTNATSQHQTELEPDTLSVGKTIVSTFQTGRFTDGGASNIGWATSKDGGATWKHGFLPGTTIYAKPAGTYARISDTAVAYDKAHSTWLVVSLALNSSGAGAAVLVSSSANGLHWNNPVAASIGSSSDFYDKTWIVCDSHPKSPYYGHCYIEFDNYALGDYVQMTTSTDGGKTWGPLMATADNAFGTGGQPLVQPNGTVVVPMDDQFESNVLAFTSSNGGSSWSSTVLITSIQRHFSNGGIRAPALIGAAIDKTGKVYVVWSDCRFESGCSANDIVMTTSTNGTSWTSVQRIPADAVGSGVDHFIPGIEVQPGTGGAKAHIALAFYYFSNTNCSTCDFTVGYVSSTNGGNTWTSTKQIGNPFNVAWAANTTQGYMVGDYISVSFAFGKAYPVFAIAKAPKGSIYHEFSASVKTGLDVVGGSNSSSGDRVVYMHHPATTSIAHSL